MPTRVQTPLFWPLLCVVSFLASEFHLFKRAGDFDFSNENFIEELTNGVADCI